MKLVQTNGERVGRGRELYWKPAGILSLTKSPPNLVDHDPNLGESVGSRELNQPLVDLGALSRTICRP